MKTYVNALKEISDEHSSSTLTVKPFPESLPTFASILNWLACRESAGSVRSWASGSLVRMVWARTGLRTGQSFTSSFSCWLITSGGRGTGRQTAAPSSASHSWAIQSASLSRLIRALEQTEQECGSDHCLKGRGTVYRRFRPNFSYFQAVTRVWNPPNLKLFAS